MAQPETPAVSAVQRYPLHAYLLGHPEARERLGPSLSAALTSGQFGAAPFEGEQPALLLLRCYVL